MEEEAREARTPPHNLEAERAVLGALLLDPSRVPEAAEALKAEDFFSPRHGALYETVLALADRSAPIDFVTVGEALAANGSFQKVGGRAYLIEVASQVTSAAHLGHHQRIVSETAALRRLIGEATSILTDAFATRPDGESVQRLIEEAESRIYKVARQRNTQGADPIASAIEEAFKRIDSSSHRRGLTGLPTGFVDLDELLCGLNAGELIILAARPSMGKTAFALNIVEHAAGHPPEWMERPPTVLLFSMEMGKQSIVSRMMCARARVDAHNLRTGKIPPDDYSALAQAAGELSGMKVFIDDSPGLTPMAVRSRARRIKQKHELDLVVVDYLQLMSHPKAESRQQEISNISRSLKELARELEVPVIALSQLSRAVESRDDKRPQLSDLRESGSIEQDADVVLLLFRPEYYNQTDENRGLAEIICAKQRNGPTGNVRLQFFGSILRFENRAPEMGEAF
jgi:replicative DNA helicase